jgi:hypothetical protein
MPSSLRLGDLLVQARLIDKSQLEIALDERRRSGTRLGVALVRLGFLDETELVAVLSAQLRLPVVRLAGKRISPTALALVPHELLERHGCLPLFVRRDADREVLYVGTADPCDREALDEIAAAAGLPVRPVLVAPTDLHEASSQVLQESRETTLTHSLETAGAVQGPAQAENRREADDATPAAAAEEALPTAPEPAPAASDAPLAPVIADDTAPLAAASADAAHSAPHGAAPVREARTRVILHALTQLLLEKGVVGRSELFERIQALEAADD